MCAGFHVEKNWFGKTNNYGLKRSQQVYNDPLSFFSVIEW